MGRTEGLTSCGSCGKDSDAFLGDFCKTSLEKQIKGVGVTSSMLHGILLPGGHRGREFQSKMTKLQEKSLA